MELREKDHTKNVLLYARQADTACECWGSSLDAGVLGTMSLNLPEPAAESPNVGSDVLDEAEYSGWSWFNAMFGAR